MLCILNSRASSSIEVMYSSQLTASVNLNLSVSIINSIKAWGLHTALTGATGNYGTAIADVQRNLSVGNL